MEKFACLIASLLAMTALPACASPGQRAGDARSFAVDETQEALQDAVGLPRQRPGQIMVDEGDDTVPTPYGGEGDRRRCSTVARDIARLTVVLGPDIEEETRREAEAEHDHEGWLGQGAHMVEVAPDAAARGARGLYRSTIVGLNPVRPVIRFLGRAGDIEREARERQDMAQRRRAYLRGLFDGFGCDAAYMRRAFQAYNLIDTGSQ
ncbi:hypothetical protein [Maricaulis sp. CAU 1757]